MVTRVVCFCQKEKTRCLMLLKSINQHIKSIPWRSNVTISMQFLMYLVVCFHTESHNRAFNFSTITYKGDKYENV